MRTRILASVTLWLVAVASIAAIAWLAIDAAGRQVTAGPVSASLASTAGGSKHADSTGGRASSAGRPASTSRASTPRTSRPATPSAPASPTGRARNPVPGTYATAGGRIGVICRGRSVTLDGGYAQPASGWSVRVASGGPQQVQVVFELNDDQALLVLADCAADGRPQFDQDRIEAGSPPQTSSSGPAPPG